MEIKYSGNFAARKFRKFTEIFLTVYVRHFHTGYGIFHCDAMKYYLILH